MPAIIPVRDRSHKTLAADGDSDIGRRGRRRIDRTADRIECRGLHVTAQFHGRRRLPTCAARGNRHVVPLPVDDFRIGRNREGDAPAEPFTVVPLVRPYERLGRSLALPAGLPNKVSCGG